MDVRQRLSDLAISDSGFVFDPYTGASFTVNLAGLTLLRSLKDGADRRALVAALRDGFEIRDGGASPDDFDRDVDEFVSQLRRFDLVPRGFELETR